MAYLRCNGAKSEPQTTTLWTNSSPSSSMENVSAMLSDSITNYDYIYVNYRSSTSSSYYFNSGMISVSDFVASGGTSYPIARPLWLGTKVNSSDNYSRAVNYSTNTSVSFSGCVKFGSTTIANSYCIPYKIYGVKMS